MQLFRQTERMYAACRGTTYVYMHDCQGKNMYMFQKTRPGKGEG
jgi:hypothetical protein